LETKTSKRIALGLIVKNEGHCIQRCLSSCKPLIDRVIFNDNGSTDDTVDKIFSWCQDNDIGFTYLPDPWVSFDINRSKVLEAAYTEKDIDYVLMIDADEVLVCEAGLNVENLKESLTCDLYDVETRMGGTTYLRPQLSSNKRKFVYGGVVHEFIVPLEEVRTRATLKGVFNMPIQDSARNKDPDKFKKDAAELQKAYDKENDSFLKSRYCFYLAQSYRDSGNIDNAIEYYLLRSKMGHWEEEVYTSLVYAGRLLRSKGTIEFQSSALTFYDQAINHNFGRAEAYYEAAVLNKDLGRFNTAYLLGKEAINKAPAPGILFAENWIYDYSLAFEMSVIAFYAGDKVSAKKLTEQCIANPRCPQNLKDHSKKNLEFYK